jgi:ABC-type phosphate transport system substrate-binding protein
MSKLNEQIKLPTTFSYRGVGSGTGIKEFLGKSIEIDGVKTDTYIPYNDFGSGDIPISTEDREDAMAQGIEFVQLPFVLSAVTFFHNIPGVPTGEDGLSKLEKLHVLTHQLFFTTRVRSFVRSSRCDEVILSPSDR